MVRPWREARPRLQTICSRLRSRTLRIAFVLFWLPHIVYATALCLAMNSANDPSVIYPSVCTKAAPDAPFGLRGDSGGRFRRGRARPPSSISQNPYGESRKVDGTLRLSIQGARFGKAAGAHSRNRAPARRKRAPIERPTPSYCRIFWLNLQNRESILSNDSGAGMLRQAC